MSIKQATTEGNKMNTSTAAAPKIKLQRGMAGWYVYYSRNNTFDIHKVAPGMWTLRHQVGHRENATAETWTAANLDAARALIASLICQHPGRGPSPPPPRRLPLPAQTRYPS